MDKVGLSCPVNDRQVNEIVIRLVAMQVIFAGATALYFQNWYIAVLLFLDFGFRAFGFSHLSPLKFIAQKTVTHFQLGYKATNEAPKKFAATIGFFVVGIFVLSLFLEYFLFASIIGGFLLLFASLESFFGICVGCMIYQQLTRFRWFNSF
ncbi:DUF4395 domain-containing protein [Fluviicola sp.]|uniref:DUF4395 domain-containing protein n=1 Tax=Fluviicola sp. TaxID=1917219 RepID=UPI003D2BE78E